MNVQLYAYDQAGIRWEVDLYETEPILLNMSIEDITDPTQVNSTFSKAFRVPATQRNSQVFKWWYEVNTIDFDVAQKVVAEIHVDGLIFKKGHVRIEAAYSNGSADNIDLELVFYGETKDFATLLGNTYVHELDMSDEARPLLTVADIESTWTGDQNIRFILADRGNDFDDSGLIVPGQGQVAFEEVPGVSYTNSFHKSPGIHINQFTPMIQVKYLIDKMFELTGYTYTADSVFNEAWFKQLYVDGNPEAAATIDKYLQDANVEYTKPTVQSFLNLDNWVQVTFPTRVNDEGPFFDGYYYTQQYTEGIDIDVSLDYQVAAVFGSGVNIQIELMANGLTIDSFSDTGITSISGTATLNYSAVQPALPAGTKIWVRAKINSTLLFNGGNVRNGNFKVSNASVLLNPSQLFRKDLKCIDGLKTLINRFRLVMEPLAFEENTFRVKPWQYYIGLGDQLDWTDKLDESKDVVLKPLFYDQVATINFTDSQGTDAVNKYYQDTYKKAYGSLIFNSDNDLLIGEKTIESYLIPTPVDQVTGLASPDSNFIIPHLYYWGEDIDSDGNVQKLPTSPQPRLWFWNGLAEIASHPTGPANNEKWFYTDGTTIKDSNQAPLYNGTAGRYPRATNVSELPTTATTLHFDWFKEFNYYDIDRTTPIGELGESSYDRFWSYYIESTYSSRARLMTAYFTLNAQDLKDLTFDDGIFIKNSWWRPVAVYNAPLSGTASVKVDLVKLLEFPGSQSGIIGDGTYDGTSGGGTWGPTSGTSGGNWGGSSSGTSGTGGNTSGTSGSAGLDTRYYELYDCAGEMAPIIGQFTGGVQPTIGYVCQVSGIAYADKCFTITRQVQGPAVTTILATFPTCIECGF